MFWRGLLGLPISRKSYEMHLSKFITLREAALLTGYHQDYLSYCIRTGRLVGQKVGKNWLTTEEALRQCFNEKDTSLGGRFFRLPRALRLAVLIVIASFILSVFVIGAYYVAYSRGYSAAMKTIGPITPKTELNQSTAD